jgi:ribosomal protein S13
MKIALTLWLFMTLFFGHFIDGNRNNDRKVMEKTIDIPRKNKQIVALVKQYGPKISSTYEKAVCTELVIQILEKIQPLNANDKKRIRIITNEDVHELLRQNSPIPKGVYYSLIEKGVGIPIADKANVLEGDIVQFWTTTWGHCGIVKSIDLQNNEMELYSSFPSTNGYGVQRFSIPKDVFFVRLK